MARGGLYLRPINVWIVWLVFKGTDLHGGFAPTEDEEAHKSWVDAHLNEAWNYAGPENRCGYVTYFNNQTTQRNASMNATPAQLFGNFGAAQPYRAGQRDFATHGLGILGDLEAYSNRNGLEAFFNFWNSLLFSGLKLQMDPDNLLQRITFTDINGDERSLHQLDLHPVRDAEKIKRLTSHYEWYRQDCKRFHVPIATAPLKKVVKGTLDLQERVRRHKDFHPVERHSVLPNTTVPDSDISMDGEHRQDQAANVHKIISRKVVGNQVGVATYLYALSTQIHRLPRFRTR